ncbi:MAG: acyl-CoA dehydrogenase family protein [Thermoleophilia bacterium]
MNFDPLPEHELLRETIRDFFARELPEETIREYDRNRKFPRELWKRFAELGWMALPVPERFGGTDADVITAAILTEEMGRRFASIAVDWVLVSMDARLIAEVGSPAQQEELLPRIASGDYLMAFGMSEPDGGTDVLGLKTRADLEGGEWVIRGQKLYTSMADDSDAILVLCRTDEPVDGKRARGLSLVITPRHQDAIQVRRLELMGMRAAGTTEVFLDGARAPEDAILGERGRGFYHLIATLDNERILAAAISLGIAGAALDEALRYAKERTAFGRPIGGFQALQHMLADTASEVEQARLALMKAAWLQSQGRECSTESAIAKLACSEAAIRATDRGLRILAGYGLVEESPMERYFRDARLGAFSPISNEMLKNFVGERLGLPKSY